MTTWASPTFSPLELARALTLHSPILNTSNFSQSGNSALENRTKITLSDTTLLHTLAGRHCVREALSTGGDGSLFSLIFSLRHATVRLWASLHLQHLAPGEAEVFRCAFAKNPEFFLNPNEIEFINSLMGGSPVIGFSALGTHVLPHGSTQCRAYDAYALPQGCPQAPLSQGFCALHAGEAWWAPCAEMTTSQAIMQEFFSQKENIFLYSDAELAQLTQRFWRRFQRTPVARPSPVLPALVYFGYKTEEDLCSQGVETLRKSFLGQARALHPDGGGAAEDFHTLRTHYEVLRAYFD